MKIEIIEYRLPAYWAGALINSDYSGLEENEIDELNDFLETIPNEYCVSASSEQYFAHNNDGSPMACDCLDYVFHIRK